MSVAILERFTRGYDFGERCLIHAKTFSAFSDSDFLLGQTLSPLIALVFFSVLRYLQGIFPILAGALPLI
jgi:hypothetical protein